MNWRRKRKQKQPNDAPALGSGLITKVSTSDLIAVIVLMAGVSIIIFALKRIFRKK